MAKKQDNDVVTETVDVAAMKKQLDDVCSKVRRMSDNWKVFAKKFVGKTDDGKMSGNMRVALAVFSLAMIATVTYAASTIWQGYNGDAVKGTCKFVSDDAGATTLTVDKVVAASGVTAPLSGAVTATTLSASSTTTLTNVTIRPSAVVTFGASGIITNAAIYGSTIGSVVPAAGAFTTVDADSYTVNAGAGLDCQSAGALQIGISTATSVDIGAAGEMTTVKGTLNVDQAVTLDSTLGVTGQATVLTKGVVVDSGAVVQMIQTTNVTMHAGTVWTNTFPIVFGATPTTVIITPTELHAAVPFYSSATPSNILVTVEADKNFTLTCIGTK